MVTNAPYTYFIGQCQVMVRVVENHNIAASIGYQASHGHQHKLSTKLK